METVKTYLYNCNLPNPIPDEYLTWLCNGFATQLPVDRVRGGRR